MWSNETTFNSATKYHSKMSHIRMNLPKNDGGLGLWNWHNRSHAFLAKTAAWMDKCISKNVKQQWESSTSSLTMQCKNVSNTIFSPDLSVKEIANLLFATPKRVLTDKQSEYSRNYKVN